MEGFALTRSGWLAIVAVGLSLSLPRPALFGSDGERPETRAHLVLVIGAPGAPEYESEFGQWAERWAKAAESAGADLSRIGPFTGSSRASSEPDLNDRQRLLREIRAAGEVSESDAAVWLVLIGHGTFYQDVAKFNLRGPDVSASEMAEELRGVDRPTVVVNCASASGPFINRLSGDNRVIVTATKSGTEVNFARFGDYLSQAIRSDRSDLDHDEQISILEAFLRASAEVRQFYQSASRLSTEHALIDDNGDGRGTPATMYRGLRPEGKSESGAELDGSRARRMTLAPPTVRLPFTAEELQRRASLEAEVDSLWSRKERLGEARYLRELEPLMVELASLYRRVEQRNSPGNSSASPEGSAAGDEAAVERGDATGGESSATGEGREEAGDSAS